MVADDDDLVPLSPGDETVITDEVSAAVNPAKGVEPLDAVLGLLPLLLSDISEAVNLRIGMLV